MTDYIQEQEMEIEALQAILMDDIKEIDPIKSGLGTENRCFEIILSTQDDADVSNHAPVELALTFSHSEKYPDELPYMIVKSIRGICSEDIKSLQKELKHMASENLGTPMVYTLVTSAKEWLMQKFVQHGQEDLNESDIEKEEVLVPHGEAVTVETFLTWRERFEAELALERAKLMSESTLAAPKEKKLTGKQWFESGKAAAVLAQKWLFFFLILKVFFGRLFCFQRGAATIESEEDEDIDLDDDFDDDEEDMLDHYLAERS